MSGGAKIKLTDEQQQAVEARGDVLIVAGAGTGKTATLVSRCEQFIFNDKNPVPINRILLVTFTEAAAAEMRLRIRKRIEESLFRSQDDSIALKQLSLLPLAHISTLHSFCFNLVKLHFHKLGLDPQVTVIEEGEAKVLASKVLDEIFNQHYSGDSDYDIRVKNLIEERSRGWDAPVRQLVLEIYYFAQSLPNSRQWLKRQYEIYNDPEPSHWINSLNNEFSNWLSEWREKLGSALNIENIAKCYSAINNILPDTDFLLSAEYINEIKTAIDSKWQRGTAKIRDSLLKEFIKDIDFFISILPSKCDDQSQENPIKTDWLMTRDQIKTLIELVIEFEEKFSNAKREISAVDFNDLEQMTIRLLIDENGKPTPVAEQLQSEFELVFVDEYQDINPAQHTIISAISRHKESANRFIVGDVKQSIYRFRRANPHIFQKLTTEWLNYQNNNDNRDGEKNVIYLSKNFRSHPSILNFVNRFFSKIMRESVCGIEYTADLYLKSGLEKYSDYETEDQSDYRVELHLVLKENNGADEAGEEDDDSGEAEPTLIQKEAALIAERLAQLKNQGYLIWDKETGKRRPVDWKDMVVLLRSPATRAKIYLREFNSRGVPLIVPCGNIFNTIEIQDIINLLKLLDNPLQDLPLAAVLRSPLVGFTDSELALLRVACRHGRLWTALKRFISSKDEIQNSIENKYSDPVQQQVLINNLQSAYRKGTQFVESYERWRKISRQVSLSHCLETIYDDTQYCAWCLAQSDGAQKHSNIQLLLEITRQFDPLQRQGLSRFLQYVEQCLEEEVEVEPASIEGDNAVRLISIHQSKGLEFPVVCLADLGKKFNFQDINSDVILDEELGICPRVHPKEFSQTYPSPIYWVARRRNLRETIGEEMRLLYVAMTRACDLLILSGNGSKTAIEKLKMKCSQSFIYPDAISKSYTPLQWICLWIWSINSSFDWLNLTSGNINELKFYINKFKYSARSKPDETEKACEIEISPELIDELKKLDAKLGWKYPFFNSTKEPAKTSVSEVRRRIVEDIEESKPFFRPSQRIIVVERDVNEKRVPAVIRGEAYHKFLELLDLRKCSSIEDINSELQRLVAAGRLPEIYARTIDSEKIYIFWNSEVGKLLLSNRDLLRRELPFTARIDTNEKEFSPLFHHLNGLENEFVIIQGVIDLCMVSATEIWILDYKTDEIKEEDIQLKNREYATQIDLYAYALSRIYNLPVTKKWIHYLSLNATVELK
ncbi:MAG: helicase-exonuclease AddAB subunit AddA [Verrucomicrobiia bacterium]